MTKEEAKQRLASRIQNFALDDDDLLALQTLIPELAESEDERIMEYLISFIELEKGVNLPPDDAEKILAYLEKQKEQKPNLELIKQSWYIEGYTDGKFKKEPMWNIKTGKGGPRYEKNEKYGQPLEKMSTEWSEEDVNNLNRICAILVEGSNIQNWWSTKRLISRDEMEKLTNFLKLIRPQPHWKPSEEQMEALQKLEETYVLEHERTQETAHLYMIIKSLKEQLLKLRRGEL